MPVCCSLILACAVAYFAAYSNWDNPESKVHVEYREPLLGPIPRILHQVFLDGEEAYLREASVEQPAFRVQWREGCKQHYDTWEYRFWTKVLPPLFGQTCDGSFWRAQTDARYICKRSERQSNSYKSGTPTSGRHGSD